MAGYRINGKTSIFSANNLFICQISAAHLTGKPVIVEITVCVVIPEYIGLCRVCNRVTTKALRKLHRKLIDDDTGSVLFRFEGCLGSVGDHGIGGIVYTGIVHNTYVGAAGFQRFYLHVKSIGSGIFGKGLRITIAQNLNTAIGIFHGQFC